METVLIAALAVAFVISAIDEFVYDLGRWKTIPVLIVSLIAVYPYCESIHAKIFNTFATAFLGLTFAQLIDALLTSPKIIKSKSLPRWVPPL